MDRSYRNYPLKIAQAGLVTLPVHRREVADYWIELLTDHGWSETEAIPMAFQKALRARFGGYPHRTGFWVPGNETWRDAPCASQRTGSLSPDPQEEDEQPTLF